VYNDPRWKRLCAQVKREQPTCAVTGCTERTTDVDHVLGLQDGGDPFNRANLQGLCKKHHSSKTASEVNARRHNPSQRDS
jgi:5-methylcytosine-specific restriction endonuclease McrA